MVLVAGAKNLEQEYIFKRLFDLESTYKTNEIISIC